MHYLDNALLIGMHGLDKLWLGGVWLVYCVGNIKGITWSHIINK